MKYISFYIILAVAMILFIQCSSTQDFLYFQPIQRDTIVYSSNNYEPVLEADDLLLITVSSIDMEAAEPFNMPIIANTTTVGSFTGTQTILKYLVKKNGTIDFPVLGEIKIAGLTRQQAKDALEKEISIYVKDPIVNLTITNFKITVLGEVKTPGTYPVSQERITLLEALGMAGDLTITGKRQNVLVIREKEGEKSYTRVDLTDDALFNSPVYYLKQNDVIYVEPNNNRVNNASYTPWIGVVFSAISLVLTVINLLI